MSFFSSYGRVILNFQDSVAYFDTAQLMSSRAEFQDKVRSEIRQQHGRMNCDVADIQVENIRFDND